MSEKQIASNTNTNTSVEPTTIVVKKRGRKSKKEIELEKAKLEQQYTYNLNWQAKGGDISEYSRLKLKNRHFSEEHRKKISESKILVVGHGKGICIIDFHE
jgi:hypothetical protein